MKTNYDLTNRKELSSVILAYLSNVPVIKGVEDVIKYFFGNDTIKAQQEAAEKLIEKGKENGVDEMEFTVDNTRGFKLNVPMDDVKIDTFVGADEKMHIKVKFKGADPIEPIVTSNPELKIGKPKKSLNWVFWIMGGAIVALAACLLYVILK